MAITSGSPGALHCPAKREGGTRGGGPSGKPIRGRRRGPANGRPAPGAGALGESRFVTQTSIVLELFPFVGGNHRLLQVPPIKGSPQHRKIPFHSHATPAVGISSASHSQHHQKHFGDCQAAEAALGSVWLLQCAVASSDPSQALDDSRHSAPPGPVPDGIPRVLPSSLFLSSTACSLSGPPPVCESCNSKLLAKLNIRFWSFLASIPLLC
ncbi:uncharacterized protein LOC110205624 [Phascolarctos cinereus]|uniref:Uncharacterized protein LOC110205624 n=1 Tax=Phascolarctos cinereus TaxID=38626 RepID=A0A6P5JYW0_PHACI|nr:uncharacterized protein LOC110205624 [Phascolarctos cinereus]